MIAATTVAIPHGKAADLGNEIQVQQGTLRGGVRDDSGIVAFKGIPYAAPPVGNLRWHAPAAPASWTGVQDHAQFGSRCLSALKNDPEPGPPRGEDCLTLNIWSGARQTGEKRPVMVWVHGGGFQFGAGSNRVYDGTMLARKGVVVVTLNYRLGVLGFMANPALDTEGSSGNYGLQDQMAALRWVKENIAGFGGDPANVTLFGESAGAHAVGILMASPLSKGLFEKAIGESGAFWDGINGPMESFEEARARGIAYEKRVGATSIEALRAMPAETLMNAALWDFTMNPEVTVFSPSVDHYVVPELPAARFARGQQMDVPLLAGWNATEQWPFRALDIPHSTPEEFRAAAARMVGKDRVGEFLKLYPAASEDQATGSADTFTGDIVIAQQTWAWLEYQKRAGQKQVYGYYFDYTSPYTPIASHIVDLPFVFGVFTPQFIVGSKTPAGDADRALSNTMMSYWTNFAAKGDPNGPGLPHWPAYVKGGEVQDLGTTVGPRANPSLARFEFIEGLRKNGAYPYSWRDLTN